MTGNRSYLFLKYLKYFLRLDRSVINTFIYVSIFFIFTLSSSISFLAMAENLTPAVEPYQGLDFAKELKGVPVRILPLFPQSLGLIYLFGEQKNVTGMPFSKIKVSLHKGGFFSQIDRAVMLKKDIGYPGMPNIENLIGLNPDLIITPSNFHMKANEFLDKLKIPQLRVHGTFSSAARWLEAVAASGLIFGKKDRADKYISYFNSVLEMTCGRIKKAEFVKRPKAAHLVKAGNKYIAYGQKSSFVKSFLKEIGCEAMGYDNKDNAETVLSQEEILKFDPDYIFIESITHASGKVNVELKEDFWKKLRAYKAGNVYFVPVDDESCFLTGWYFNLAAPLGVLWTAKIIYPELFADIDVEIEADKFYKEFLNIDRCKMLMSNSLLNEPAGRK